MTDYDWEMQERKFENDMAAIDLEAENAKLRERVAELEELTDEKRYIPQEWYQLATAENAKLRELVKDIWRVIVREYPRGGFPDMGRFERRVRDMGLEVE